MSNDLVQLMADLKEQEALEIVRGRLDAGEDPLLILNDSREALAIVGKRFAAHEYFIPELIYSGEIAKEIAELVKPRLSRAQDIKRSGKVVIGTVAGDIHDIGKNIVTFMLEASGFEVYDIGIDQSPVSFIDKVKQTGSGVVGLSGFLTLAFNSMKDTVEEFKSAGLRDRVKIMIGGGQMNEEVRKYTGADAYGMDAMAAVALAREWTGGK